MDINQLLMDYDNMFGVNSLEEIEEFLVTNIENAMEEKDYGCALSLMNEMMSFCRDTSQKEKGLHYCNRVEDMLIKLGLEGSVDYATSLINVANAYRAFGQFDKSQVLYERVDVIYKEKLPKDDFNFASLYNNWSLLYQETKEYRQAELLLRRALAVIDTHDNALIQQATTRCNLASTLLQIASDAQPPASEALYDEALQFLQRALRIFEWDGKRDFHYSAALCAMGDALFMHKDYVQAAGYYKQAMEELEKHVGKTENYARVQEKYEKANELAQELLKKDTVFAEDELEDTYVDTLSEDAEAQMQTQPAAQAQTEKKEETASGWVAVCKEFYETYGAKMIAQEYPNYEKRIAVGLVGEGSECFGFDDAISRDHDYGLGFCMWLSEEDYRSIGGALQRSYEQLLVDMGETFLTEHREAMLQGSVNKKMNSRRGVFSIRGFYENTLGVKLSRTQDNGYILPESWMQIPEDRLATATNGMVFRDDEGNFTSIRDSLKEYYPTNVWMLRLAEKLHGFAQNAQSNYARMMARKDYVTAQICVAQGMRYAMEIVYMLNQSYAPYYKWMRKGLNGLSQVPQVAGLVDEIAVIENQAKAWENQEYNPYKINFNDKVIKKFEDIAEYILLELKMQGVVKGTETFMDVHCQDLIQRVGNGDFGGVEDAEMEAMYAEYVKQLRQEQEEAMQEEAEESESEITDVDAPKKTGRVYEWGAQDDFNRDEVIAEIVEAEWKQFDKVKNEGGRADCQDDWNTFSIMRKSQYMAWPNQLLSSYLSDLKTAKANGWNLIMEKYARMMKSTAPDKYRDLEDKLPVRSEQREAIMEEIISIQVTWMEAFAMEYPKMAGNARSIHTSEDSAYNTSYETYLRGELGTYSEETFVLYGRFITELAKSGGNLAYDIMTNTARLYGYADVDDAEKRLK